MLVFLMADMDERASGTFRAAGMAEITPEKDHLVVGLDPPVLRHLFLQLPLDDINRIPGIAEAKTL